MIISIYHISIYSYIALNISYFLYVNLPDFEINNFLNHSKTFQIIPNSYQIIPNHNKSFQIIPNHSGIKRNVLE